MKTAKKEVNRSLQIITTNKYVNRNVVIDNEFTVYFHSRRAFVSNETHDPIN